MYVHAQNSERRDCGMAIALGVFSHSLSLSSPASACALEQTKRKTCKKVPFMGNHSYSFHYDLSPSQPWDTEFILFSDILMNFIEFLLYFNKWTCSSLNFIKDSLRQTFLQPHKYQSMVKLYKINLYLRNGRQRSSSNINKTRVMLKHPKIVIFSFLKFLS